VARKENEIRQKGSRIFYKREVGIVWIFYHPMECNFKPWDCIMQCPNGGGKSPLNDIGVKICRPKKEGP